MNRREAIQAVVGGAAGLLAPVTGLGRSTGLDADEAAVLAVLRRGEPFVATERVVAVNAGLSLEDTQDAITELARQGHARQDESMALWRRAGA